MTISAKKKPSIRNPIHSHQVVIQATNNLDLAKRIQEEVSDKFFTIQFRKLNNDIRILNGRLGVTKDVETPNDLVSYNKFLTVFDLKERDFRMANLETVISFTCNKKLFLINRSNNSLWGETK